MNDTNPQTIIAWTQATSYRKTMMNLIFTFIAIVLIAEAIYIFRQSSHVGDNNAQYVTVTGKSDMYVKPDTLQFNITINEDGKDVGEATTKATEKANKAIEILKANGVEEKNIKTTNWSTNDKYESVSTPCAAAVPTMAPSAVSGKVMYAPYPVAPCTNTTSKIVGATVYQTLEVKIQDIEKNATTEKRGKIVSELATANIKTDSFIFTVFDLDAVKVKARTEAIQKAREDAKTLSRDLGVGLREISGFSENNGEYNPYMSARAEPMMAMDKAGGVVPAPQLPTGEQKVTSSVTITYLLK